MTPSTFVPTINEGTDTYKGVWVDRDETENFSQKHDQELIKEEKRLEVSCFQLMINGKTANSCCPKTISGHTLVAYTFAMAKKRIDLWAYIVTKFNVHVF